MSRKIVLRTAQVTAAVILGGWLVLIWLTAPQAEYAEAMIWPLLFGYPICAFLIGINSWAEKEQEPSAEHVTLN